MPQANQRQPVPYQNTPRTIEIVQDVAASERVIHLADEVKQLQKMSTVSAGRTLRRLFFIWFRVYVDEVRHGKHQKVNVKIPLPIPLVGTVFARQLSFQSAAKLTVQARHGEDISDYLDSVMGLELVRVDESNERGKSQLVVVGFD